MRTFGVDDFAGVVRHKRLPVNHVEAGEIINVAGHVRAAVSDG